MSHIAIQRVPDGAAWDQQSRTIINNAIKRLEYSDPIGVPDANTGATYTFAMSDANHVVLFNRATAQTVTVPPNADVPYEIGTKIQCLRLGVGLVTFAAGAGVTLRMPTGIKPNRFMGAQAIKSADETTANYSGGATVPWTSENYDTDAWHDNSSNNSRLTVPAGLGITKVDIAGIVLATLNTVDEFSLATILKSGGAFHGNPQLQYDGPAAAHRLSPSGKGFAATAGDYFELFYQTETDASVTINAANSGFSIMAVAIDPVGTITSQYGSVDLLKIGTNEWVLAGPALG